jgi:transposase InsO family protein
MLKREGIHVNKKRVHRLYCLEGLQLRPKRPKRNVSGAYRKRVCRLKGTPKRIHCDNGSEFAGQMIDLWAYTNKVTLAFSRSGKPTDNAFIESLNGSFRDECLNCHWFESLSDAKLKVEAW